MFSWSFLYLLVMSMVLIALELPGALLGMAATNLPIIFLPLWGLS